jgi:[ribosomal protein S5]-alanine N-acetyltransferase
MSRQIVTARLILRGTDAAFAASAAGYLQRNRAHLDPWSPPAQDDFFTETGQLERLRKALEAEQRGTDRAWWLFARHEPEHMVGTARLTQIVRGPFCSAMLGYGIDVACEGQGLMQEALRAVIGDAFGGMGGQAPLHRIQANVRTDNVRSSRVLERLGFVEEGLAAQYLFIDGAWRDHRMFALRHPDWPVDRPPPSA